MRHPQLAAVHRLRGPLEGLHIEQGEAGLPAGRAWAPRTADLEKKKSLRDIVRPSHDLAPSSQAEEKKIIKRRGNGAPRFTMLR